MATHQLDVQEYYFNKIEEGTKTVEGRAGKVDTSKNINENYKEHRSIYKAGDRLQFTVSGKENSKTLLCDITAVKFYDGFENMLRQSGLQNCLPDIDSIDKGVEIYRSFPGYADREVKYGAVGIHIRLIDS